MEKELEKAWKRGTRNLAKLGVQPTPEIEWDHTKAARGWLKFTEKEEGGVMVEEAKQLKVFLRDLIVAPMDKSPGEAAII